MFHVCFMCGLRVFYVWFVCFFLCVVVVVVVVGCGYGCVSWLVWLVWMRLVWLWLCVVCSVVSVVVVVVVAVVGVVVVVLVDLVVVVVIVVVVVVVFVVDVVVVVVVVFVVDYSSILVCVAPVRYPTSPVSHFLASVLPALVAFIPCVPRLPCRGGLDFISCRHISTRLDSDRLIAARRDPFGLSQRDLFPLDISTHSMSTSLKVSPLYVYRLGLSQLDFYPIVLS